MANGGTLEAIYDEHADALYTFLLSRLRDPDVVRDVLQDVFWKLARKSDPLAGIDNQRSYLIRLAHNQSIDHCRRRETWTDYHELFAREPARIFASTEDPDETAFCHAVEEALAGLPENQRTVVHLKLRQSMTFDQIAHTLDIPPNTAASRYRYGIDKLRDALRPLYAEII